MGGFEFVLYLETIQRKNLITCAEPTFGELNPLKFGV